MRGRRAASRAASRLDSRARRVPEGAAEAGGSVPAAPRAAGASPIPSAAWPRCVRPATTSTPTPAISTGTPSSTSGGPSTRCSRACDRVGRYSSAEPEPACTRSHARGAGYDVTSIDLSRRSLEAGGRGGRGAGLEGRHRDRGRLRGGGRSPRASLRRRGLHRCAMFPDGDSIAAAIGEAAQVLAPGGRLVIFEPNSLASSGSGDAGRGRQYRESERNYRFDPPWSLMQACREAGLTEVTVTYRFLVPAWWPGRPRRSTRWTAPSGVPGVRRVAGNIAIRAAARSASPIWTGVSERRHPLVRAALGRRPRLARQPDTSARSTSCPPGRYSPVRDRRRRSVDDTGRVEQRRSPVAGLRRRYEELSLGQAAVIAAPRCRPSSSSTSVGSRGATSPVAWRWAFIRRTDLVPRVGGRCWLSVRSWSSPRRHQRVLRLALLQAAPPPPIG